MAHWTDIVEGAQVTFKYVPTGQVSISEAYGEAGFVRVLGWLTTIFDEENAHLVELISVEKPRRVPPATVGSRIRYQTGDEFILLPRFATRYHDRPEVAEDYVWTNVDVAGRLREEDLLDDGAWELLYDAENATDVL